MNEKLNFYLASRLYHTHIPYFIYMFIGFNEVDR